MLSRTRFLGSVTVAGMLAAAAPLAAAPLAASIPDVAAFEARIARPFKHKQVAGAVALRGAAFLHYLKNTLNAYEFAWKEGPGTTHVAAVLYGPSIAAVLSDAIWSEYKLADVLAGLQDTFAAGHAPQTTDPYAGDPALAATGKSTDAFYTADGVAQLQKRGASFFVCNNALVGFSQAMLKSTNAAAIEALRAKLAQNFIDGAMLVPAGVAAINACQEQHFTYLNGNAV